MSCWLQRWSKSYYFIGFNISLMLYVHCFMNFLIIGWFYDQLLHLDLIIQMDDVIPQPELASWGSHGLKGWWRWTTSRGPAFQAKCDSRWGHVDIGTNKVAVAANWRRIVFKTGTTPTNMKVSFANFHWSTDVFMFLVTYWVHRRSTS